MIINVASLSKDLLNSSDAFLFSLMSQHCAFHYVADGIYTFDIGLPVVIDLNLSSLVNCDTGLVELKTLCVGPATGCHKYVVTFEGLFLVGVYVFNVDLTAVGAASTSIDLGLEGKFDSLFFENLFERARYF